MKQILVISQDIKHSILYGGNKRVVDFKFFVGMIYLLKHYKCLKSKSEVFEDVHFKLHSSNEKTTNIVGIFRAPSHGVRARFLRSKK